MAGLNATRVWRAGWFGNANAVTMMVMVVAVLQWLRFLSVVVVGVTRACTV